jgi:hypothetical protein
LVCVGDVLLAVALAKAHRRHPMIKRETVNRLAVGPADLAQDHR